MGLDMYAFATRTAPAAPVDFKADHSQELAYWRKHPNLHGRMEHLYRAKGGTAEDFNCVNLQLDVAAKASDFYRPKQAQTALSGT
ncbi:MAG: hypothetical protein INF97_18455 [Roseomonas sp.]|nr:hypothetical protein [Roseomonas sp.]